MVPLETCVRVICHWVVGVLVWGHVFCYECHCLCVGYVLHPSQCSVVSDMCGALAVHPCTLIFCLSCIYTEFVV